MSDALMPPYTLTIAMTSTWGSYSALLSTTPLPAVEEHDHQSHEGVDSL